MEKYTRALLLEEDEALVGGDYREDYRFADFVGRKIDNDEVVVIKWRHDTEDDISEINPTLGTIMSLEEFEMRAEKGIF